MAGNEGFHFCARRLAAAMTGIGLGLALTVSHAAEPQAPAAQKTTQSESYLMIEPMYASILDGITPRGLLLVEMGLDVPDPQFRTRVNAALPVLRDAYVRSLLIYAATSVRIWRQPSVDDIANRLQAITDQVMGEKGARVLMAQTAIRIN